MSIEESKFKRILFRIKTSGMDDLFFIWLDTGVDDFYEERLRKFDHIFRHAMDLGNVSHMNVLEFLRASTQQVEADDIPENLLRRTQFLLGRKLYDIGSFDEIYCTQLNGCEDFPHLDDEGNPVLNNDELLIV